MAPFVLETATPLVASLEPNTAWIAAASMRSPKGVDVACALT